MIKVVTVVVVLVVALMHGGALAANFSTELRNDYYDQTCPQLESTVARTSWYKYNNSKVVAAGVLRIYFHDCWVAGCDASVMLMSTEENQAEKDAQENLSLSGDGFDAITQAKLAVEEVCPGVVSCADLITLVTRDLIILTTELKYHLDILLNIQTGQRWSTTNKRLRMPFDESSVQSTGGGGPRYEPLYGRLDGRTSRAEDAVAVLPRARDSMDKLIENFASQNFSSQEMLALLGGHTIGFAHCSEFDYRVYNYTSTSKVDPILNATAEESMLGVCPIGVDPLIVGNLDNTTPEDFDNAYFYNLQNREGVLESDQILFEDPRTRPGVNAYAENQTLWYRDFVAAMMKLGTLNVKTTPGPDAEIRRDCAFIN